MKSIILIGYMGAGKSTIGKILAEKKQIPFFDTDIGIEEKQGRKISEIFRQEGEEYFRGLETDMLEELKEQKQKQVIATGGGLPMKVENQELLKKIGVIFYLVVKKETILERLREDKSRPLLMGEEKEKKIEKRGMEEKAVKEIGKETIPEKVRKSPRSTSKKSENDELNEKASTDKTKKKTKTTEFLLNEEKIKIQKKIILIIYKQILIKRKYH